MKKFFIISVLLVNIILTLTAAAQDIPFFWGNKWNSGGRAAGMGGAYTGVARGEGAFVYNPAGLGLAKTTELYANFSRISSTNSSTVFGQSSSEDIFSNGLNSIGLVFPIPTSRGSLVFGVGYNKSHDFDRSLYGEFFNSQPNDSVTQGYSEIETGSLGRTALSFAMETAPNMFIGGSINFWSGQNDYTSQFFEKDEPFNMWTFAEYYETTNILTKFSAVNYTFSGLIKIYKMFQFGASIYSPITLTSSEDWSYSMKTNWDDGLMTTDSTDAGEYTYKLQSPWKFRVGGSVKTGPLLVSADVELNDYSQIKFNDDPPSGGTKAEANFDIRRNLRNTVDYSVGGEFTVPKTGVCLRAGYSIRKTPYKESDFAKDRQYMSFGCGVMVTPQITLNLSYSTTSWNRSFDETVQKEDISVKNIVAGFIYQL